MNRTAFVVLVAVTMGSSVAIGQTLRYNLGRPATAEELKKRDISVAPDGTGLPPGRGTIAQGRNIYSSLCASCHGERGQGVGNYPALVGGQGTLATKNPVLTIGSYWPYATTVWDYIHRAMPYRRPGKLTPDETYAVTGFILYLNGLVDERTELTEKSLPQVKMPNRNGFVPDPRPDVSSRKGNGKGSSDVDEK